MRCSKSHSKAINHQDCVWLANNFLPLVRHLVTQNKTSQTVSLSLHCYQGLLPAYLRLAHWPLFWSPPNLCMLLYISCDTNSRTQPRMTRPAFVETTASGAFPPLRILDTRLSMSLQCGMNELVHMHAS